MEPTGVLTSASSSIGKSKWLARRCPMCQCLGIDRQRALFAVSLSPGPVARYKILREIKDAEESEKSELLIGTSFT